MTDFKSKHLIRISLPPYIIFVLSQKSRNDISTWKGFVVQENKQGVSNGSSSLEKNAENMTVYNNIYPLPLTSPLCPPSPSNFISHSNAVRKQMNYCMFCVPLQICCFPFCYIFLRFDVLTIVLFSFFPFIFVFFCLTNFHRYFSSCFLLPTFYHPLSSIVDMPTQPHLVLNDSAFFFHTETMCTMYNPFMHSLLGRGLGYKVE